MGVTIRILENPNTKRNNVLNKKTRKIEVTYMIEFLVYNFFCCWKLCINICWLYNDWDFKFHYQLSILIFFWVCSISLPTLDIPSSHSHNIYLLHHTVMNNNLKPIIFVVINQIQALPPKWTIMQLIGLEKKGITNGIHLICHQFMTIPNGYSWIPMIPWPL